MEFERIDGNTVLTLAGGKSWTEGRKRRKEREFNVIGMDFLDKERKKEGEWT